MVAKLPSVGCIAPSLAHWLEQWSHDPVLVGTVSSIPSRVHS